MKSLIGSVFLSVTMLSFPVEAHPSDEAVPATTRSSETPRPHGPGSTAATEGGVAPRRSAPAALFAGLGDEATARLPVRESPAAHGMPEADPGDRFTPRASRASRSSELDQVVVKVDGLSSDRPVLSELALPDLSAASTVELRQAFGQLLWKPSEKQAKTEVTLLFRVER
jgi:hypothetical protein